MAGNTLSASKALFKTFGFTISMNKLNPFSHQAEILGVVADCSEFKIGKLKFRMKESRRAELVEALRDGRVNLSVIPRDLPSFLGRRRATDGQSREAGDGRLA